MTYRLHIDIPINGDENEALRVANEIIRFCLDNQQAIKVMKELGVEQANYRLGHDEDRQKSNYFIKSPSGHVNNKKSRIKYITGLTSDEEAV